MSAAKAKPTSKASGKPRQTATSKARTAATGAAKGVAKSAAKGAAKGAASSAAKGAKRAASNTVAVGGDRLGRGTRWSEEQVTLLLEAVAANPTAKEAFEKVAGQLGKSAGTVGQKYYNLQKASSGGSAAARTPGRSAGGGGARATSQRSPGAGAAGGLPGALALRALTVDELVGLATRVKGEIDRRRQELDAASKLLKG